MIDIILHIFFHVNDPHVAILYNAGQIIFLPFNGCRAYEAS